MHYLEPRPPVDAVWLIHIVGFLLSYSSRSFELPWSLRWRPARCPLRRRVGRSSSFILVSRADLQLSVLPLVEVIMWRRLASLAANEDQKSVKFSSREKLAVCEVLQGAIKLLPSRGERATSLEVVG
jgi:hypothetical protein